MILIVLLCRFGTPDKILTDNGKEFVNKEFKKYCDKKEIKLLHGRVRHPQTQGAVERYNRTIKELLKNEYLEKEEKFDLEKSLENALNIYNSIKHSTTGFTPELLFYSVNKNLFKKVSLIKKIL